MTNDWRNLGVGWALCFAMSAQAAPSVPIVLETDPSVTVGAPPPSRTNKRIEPALAPKPFVPQATSRPTAKSAAVPEISRPLASMQSHPPTKTTNKPTKTASSPVKVGTPANASPPVLTKAAPAAKMVSVPEVTILRTTKPVPTTAAHADDRPLTVAVPAADRDALVRAQLTSEVREREPVDKLDPANISRQQVYYFTELKGLSGQTVVHRWEYQGEIKHEQKLKITSGRFRTYSKKTLNPKFIGEWRVSVSDNKGHVLDSKTFTFANPGATAQTQ